uniref:Uncharacterized protein n=1 Tax=Strigamia maritima TaxID=126957 RepID=T1JNY5_STRMM
MEDWYRILATGTPNERHCCDFTCRINYIYEIKFKYYAPQFFKPLKKQIPENIYKSKHNATTSTNYRKNIFSIRWQNNTSLFIFNYERLMICVMLHLELVGVFFKVFATPTIFGISLTMTGFSKFVKFRYDRIYGEVLTERSEVLTERSEVLTERSEVLTERSEVLTERSEVLTPNKRSDNAVDSAAANCVISPKFSLDSTSCALQHRQIKNDLKNKCL